MDAARKRKWVKEMRSGKYEQCKGHLRNEDGYCCIGILHKVVTGKEPPDLYIYPMPKWIRGDPQGFAMPEWADELAYMNDQGVPFEMIAGFVQENL